MLSKNHSLIAILLTLSFISTRSAQKDDSNIPLVDDDIVTPTCWIESPANPEPEQLPQDLGTNPDGNPRNPNACIRKRQYYRPQIVNSNNLIIFIVIHGTWGAKKRILL